MPETSKKELILIVANDAGGANLVAAWCASQSNFEFIYCLSGPAIKLFQEMLGPIDVHDPSEIESMIFDVTRLVCGTSRVSTDVVGAIRLAQDRGILSTAFLDHWVNYPLRFGGDREFKENLPDQLWVFDDHAMSQAIDDGFPSEIVSLHGNPYIRRVIDSVNKQRQAASNDQNVVLFLSEPVDQILEAEGKEANTEGWNEFQALEDVVRAVTSVNAAPLLIRLHPQEPIGKYDDLLDHSSEFGGSISSEPDLASDLARAKVVIGSNSTAMVIAVTVGIRTISYIPYGGDPCVLPHIEIEKIRDRDKIAELIKSAIL
jgi:hypothetical protein